MSSRDYTRIDEVYHNMYKNKFHREEPLVQEEKECDGDCEECDDCNQDKSSTPLQKKERAKYLKSAAGEAAEEELGPDPKEADELEAIAKKYGRGSFFKDEPKHEPDYQSTPFWDAYKSVLAGQWSEDEFHQWAQTVWNAGAEESQRH
jgi:hypothetical protein